MRRPCVDAPVPRVAGLAALLLLAHVSLFSLGLSGAAGPARVQAQEAAPTVDSVLARMARIPGLHTSYREEKRIALLSSPIVSEGTIDYARGAGSRPPRMARRTTRPSAQVVLIDAGELRMNDGRTTSRIDLASQPVVRSFVDSFLQLLVGDRAALERTYTLSIERVANESPAGGWSLVLRPRGAPLSSFLREIRFEGQGDVLTRMVMTEVSGDVTTTTFSDVDANHRYDAAEASRVFSLTL
ncbi:MAG: outer membrane lipoprotein carrier protein LolA [Deltaproteobacteria bacterium]|nr:outer membrane lipoprotein carrier protein LolA [Deltaproteobacteria bacterium]